jgi:hypothetical protein
MSATPQAGSGYDPKYEFNAPKFFDFEAAPQNGDDGADAWFGELYVSVWKRVVGSWRVYLPLFAYGVLASMLLLHNTFQSAILRCCTHRFAHFLLDRYTRPQRLRD